ncbi:MAG: PhoH family protein [Micrococcales bacterium]|nr:PhoH family protein [Micrococcales bacterium]
MTKSSTGRKTFIIDTSVLLYDKCSIHSFPGNDVVIPLIVLDELDRFKDKPGLLGEYARYVNRYLDDLRNVGSLHDGVTINHDQTIRVEIDIHEIPASLDGNTGDNRIIAAALALKAASDQPVVMVTKDINFRVKCDSLGIYSEDYYKDRIVHDKSEIYSGQAEVEAISPSVINHFYDDGSISTDHLDFDLNSNQYVTVKYGNQSLIGVHRDGNVVPLINNLTKTIGITPRNKEQKFAIDALTRDDVKLVSMTGLAGSGKTFLTLMAGMSGIQDKRYDRIVITRSLQTVGKEIGFLPGDIDDKMSPWLSPILDNFRVAFKDSTYFEMMRQKGQIEVSPLAFIRGRTFNNTFLIVDEAQNSTIHELKTIITRIGEGSKIVLLGDTDQIDTPYLDSLSNGLTVIVEKFKKYDIAAHITLMKGERSELATLASQVL